MSEKIIKVEKVARVEDEGWVVSKAERKKVEAGEVILPDGVNPTEIAPDKDDSEPDNLHQPTDADGEPWTMYDNVRGGDFKNPNTYNANAKGLYANSNAQENDASGRYKDFTNDGFKVRGTSGEQNSTGGFYIYMAWAEAPAFNLYGASAPAR